MNKVVLVGRITKDPELKKSSNDTYYVQFTIAVNRQYKSASGERQADFIGCIAWRQTAEIIAKYVRKGQQIGIDGSIQTRNYDDQNGVKHFVTEVVVDNFYFLEPKKDDMGTYDDYQQPNPYMNNMGNVGNMGNRGYNQNYNPQYNMPQGFGPQAFNNQPYQQTPRPYGQPNNQNNYKAQQPYNSSAQQKQKDIFEDIDSFVSDDDLPF